MGPLLYAGVALGGIVVFTTLLIATKGSKNKKIKKSFINLKNKFENLNNSNLENKINKLKSMSKNNKEYVSVYEEINKEYLNIVNIYTLEMETEFNKIDVMLSDKNYKEAKEYIEQISGKVKQYEKELKVIDEKLNSIMQEEETLREIVVPLKERFRALKANFYEHKEELSVCEKVFESKINKLEKTIADLDKKLENGYYKEAKELIEEVTKDVSFYEEHLSKMPQLVSFSMQVLPKRLEQAMAKYQEMKKDGYPLYNIKSSTIEEQIKDRLGEIRVRFEEFNYDDINDSIKEIAYDIERFSESLENEETSKNSFNDNIDKVYEFIDNIGKRFLKAKRDTNSIKNVYYMEKEKSDTLIYLENQIHILNRIKMELDAYIHSATKQPYSVLSLKMGELKEFGEELDETLTEYQNYIVSLKTTTEYAYEKVNSYSIEVNTLYSTLKGLNHKVLSTIYEEQYLKICDLIQDTNKKLQTKPINVKEASEECTVLINEAEELLKDMNNSLKMYNMAQNIIVFTNKYRSSFTTVNEVLNRAQIHFENGEFEFAIDSVSEVLQEVHPNAYEEMMKSKGYKDE